jgi:alkylation response protein AidB-like acyl-CoA dehydrogenase
MATVAAPKRTLFEPERDDYRESFQKFLAAEVVPHYGEWRADHIIPRELFTKAAGHGFLAMAVPEQYGGNGVDDWRFNVVLIEEAAYANVADASAGPSPPGAVAGTVARRGVAAASVARRLESGPRT